MEDGWTFAIGYLVVNENIWSVKFCQRSVIAHSSKQNDHNGIGFGSHEI